MLTPIASCVLFTAYNSHNISQLTMDMILFPTKAHSVDAVLGSRRVKFDGTGMQAMI